MEKAQPNNNNATRENLYVLSLIRGVALLGQVLALIYFTWVQSIGLPVAEIAFVLSVYGSLTAAIWVRSRRAGPQGERRQGTKNQTVGDARPEGPLAAPARDEERPRAGGRVSAGQRGPGRGGPARLDGSAQGAVVGVQKNVICDA